MTDVLPGDWCIMLVAFSTYADVTLTASLIGPDFTSEGVTNGASFLPPVSPGAIFTIFGTKLASAEVSAAAKPLPVLLGGTSVTVNEVAAQLYFVSPLQINAQMPFETQPGQATVVVKAGELSSAEVKITVLPSAPGLFLHNGRAIVQNEDWQLNDPGHPARAGAYVVAYVTGVSPLDNPIATGAPAPDPPLSSCTAPYSATIGGQPAEVAFLGLTPGFVGLGQANIKVPALPAGDHPLKIKIGEVERNSSVIAVAP